MNSNLPERRKKRGLFYKIKTIIKEIFSKRKVENNNDNETKAEDILDINFRNDLKSNVDTDTIFLHDKINQNQIKLIDLSDKQLCDMISFYQKESNNKKFKNRFNYRDDNYEQIRIRELKNKLDNNELQESSLSEDDRNKIIDLYVKEIIYLNSEFKRKKDDILKLKKVLEKKGA